MWSKFIRQYFVFSKKERVAAIVLAFLIGLVYSVPYVVPEPSLQTDTTGLRGIRQVAELLNDNAQSGDARGRRDRQSIDSDDLSSGPHSLNISEENISGVNPVSSKPYRASTHRYSKPPPEQININLADSLQWEALPGIGPKLTSRILAFREKLGGFYSIEQIRETYGLPDSVFQKIKPLLKKGTETVRQLNVNTATEEELRRHPYIRFNGAKAITRYRSANGPFTSVDDLQKVVAIRPEEFQKMKPYLKY